MDMTSPDAPNNCRNNSTVLKFSLSTAYHFSLASCTQLILGCAKVCWCPLVNFLGLFEAGFEKLKMVRWWAKNNDLCQWCHLEFQLELVLASASDGRTCAPSPNEVPLEQGCLVLQPSWGAGGAGGLGLRWNCCHCAVTPPLAASHHPETSNPLLPHTPPALHNGMSVRKRKHLRLGPKIQMGWGKTPISNWKFCFETPEDSIGLTSNPLLPHTPPSITNPAPLSLPRLLEFLLWFNNPFPRTLLCKTCTRSGILITFLSIILSLMSIENTLEEQWNRHNLARKPRCYLGF